MKISLQWMAWKTPDHYYVNDDWSVPLKTVSSGLYVYVS